MGTPKRKNKDRLIEITGKKISKKDKNSQCKWVQQMSSKMSENRQTPRQK